MIFEQSWKLGQLYELDTELAHSIKDLSLRQPERLFHASYVNHVLGLQGIVMKRLVHAKRHREDKKLQSIGRRNLHWVKHHISETSRCDPRNIQWGYSTCADCTVRKLHDTFGLGRRPRFLLSDYLTFWKQIRNENLDIYTVYVGPNKWKR